MVDARYIRPWKRHHVRRPKKVVVMASSGFRSNRSPKLAHAGQGAQALNLRRDRQHDDEHEDGSEDHPLDLVWHGRRHGRRLGGLLSPLFSLTRWLWRVHDFRK